MHVCIHMKNTLFIFYIIHGISYIEYYPAQIGSNKVENLFVPIMKLISFKYLMQM